MGVTFVSGEPIKTGELEGYRARYRFDDISKVTVKMDQGANSLAPGGDTQEAALWVRIHAGASRIAR